MLKHSCWRIPCTSAQLSQVDQMPAPPLAYTMVAKNLEKAPEAPKAT